MLLSCFLSQHSTPVSQVHIEAEFEKDEPFALMLPAGAADGGLPDLRDAIADEIELTTGRPCDPGSLVLQAKVSAPYFLLPPSPPHFVLILPTTR